MAHVRGGRALRGGPGARHALLARAERVPIHDGDGAAAAPSRLPHLPRLPGGGASPSPRAARAARPPRLQERRLHVRHTPPMGRPRRLPRAARHRARPRRRRLPRLPGRAALVGVAPPGASPLLRHVAARPALPRARRPPLRALLLYRRVFDRRSTLEHGRGRAVRAKAHRRRRHAARRLARLPPAAGRVRRRVRRVWAGRAVGSAPPTPILGGKGRRCDAVLFTDRVWPGLLHNVVDGAHFDTLVQRAQPPARRGQRPRVLHTIMPFTRSASLQYALFTWILKRQPMKGVPFHAWRGGEAGGGGGGRRPRAACGQARGGTQRVRRRRRPSVCRLAAGVAPLPPPRGRRPLHLARRRRRLARPPPQLPRPRRPAGQVGRLPRPRFRGPPARESPGLGCQLLGPLAPPPKEPVRGPQGGLASDRRRGARGGCRGWQRCVRT
mmetsp:Transcript_46915/g.151421  ORF Transcript_46915/g.151421 Transcript_46915/m.151421 type:complete len:440 (-) Transcript_46915:311-1630(-)